MAKLTYFARDFEELRNQLVAAIPSKTDRWTDFNESDIGITLLELWAYIGDMLGYYLDQQALETYLPTVRQRRNLMNIVKLLGYQLSHVASSTTLLEISLDSAHDARIEIPKYTRVASTGDATVYFVTTSLSTIPTGDTSVLVGAKQGVLYTETFSTDGSESQRFRLQKTLVDIDSIEVVANNVVWSKVDSFVNSQSGDRHYIVEVDHQDNVDVVFGDGFYGYLPPSSPSANVTIRYLESLGSDGNIGTNTIETLLDTIRDVNGTEVSLSVTNTQAATGGEDRETVEHAKKQAPAELSALFRAMTKADYIALAEGFPGVGKANCWGEQDEGPPDYDLYNWVFLAISPQGVTRSALLEDVANGQVSSELKVELLNYLEQRKCITTRLRLVDPVYVPIDLQATVYYQGGYLASQIKAEVESTLLDFFDYETVTYGKEVRQSNIIRLIDGVDGVDYVTLSVLKTEESVDDLNAVLVLNKYELPYLRSFTITMAKTSDTPALANVHPCPPVQPIARPD